MNDQIMSWVGVFLNAVQGALHKLIWFLPNVIVALMFLLLGSIVGRWIGCFVEKALGKLKIAELATAANVNKYLEPFGVKSPQQLFGKLTHIFIFLITLIAAADILHLPQVTSLIQTVLLYIPKAIVALLILLVGLAAARVSDGFLKGELVQSVPALKGFVRFLIVSFALLASLNQFEIAPRLVEILFGGLIFAMSLALGLAFGLGGKGTATEILDRLYKKKP